jgi:hypothetical protein
MSFATTTVEIAFGSAPLAGTYSWTDVTAYVKEFSTKRGRDYELDQIQAGTATFTLDNADGRFTPGRAASPYFPNVIPRRRVRIRTTDPLATPSVVITPPSIDSTATATTASGTTLSWSHTVGAGANRCLVVDVAIATNGDYVGTVTYGGVALTKLTAAQSGATGTDRRYERWMLLSPAVGTATVAVTLYLVSSGNATGVVATSIAAESTSLVSVDQTTPVGTAVAVNGTGTTTGTLAPSIGGYDLVLTGVVARTATPETASGTLTSATLLAGTNCYMGYGTANGTSSWSWSVSDVYAAVATPFHGATVTGPAAPTAVFTGFVESWQQSFVGGGPDHSEVTMTAVDGFKVLGNASLRRQYVATALGAYSTGLPADALYMLGEDSTATAATDIGGTYPPATPVGSDFAFGQSGIIPGDSGSSLRLGNARLPITTPSGGLALPASAGTVEFWFKPNTLPASGKACLFSAAPAVDPAYGGVAGTGAFALTLDSAGNIALTVPNGTAAPGTTTVATVAAGTAVYLCFKYSSAGWNLQAGASQVGSGTAMTTTGPFVTLSLGGAPLGDPAQAYVAVDGSFQGFAAWAHRENISTVNDYKAGTNGWTNEDECSRMTRVLGYVGWPAADIGFNAVNSLSKLSGASWGDSSNALTLLQQYATDAGGYLFINPAGVLTYHDRQHRLNQTTPRVFQESAGTGVEGDVQFHLDDSYVINQMHVTNGLGQTTVATDSGSITTYGSATKDLTLNVVSLNEAFDAAAWHIALYKNPLIRCDTLTVEPVTSDALWNPALNLEIGTRITVSGLPSSAPGSSVNFIVEAVKHDVLAEGGTPSWRTTLQLSPDLPILGLTLDDDTFGLLDTDCLVY